MNKFSDIFKKKTILGLIIIVLLFSLSIVVMQVSAESEDDNIRTPEEMPDAPLDLPDLDWRIFEPYPFPPIVPRIYLPVSIQLIEGPSNNLDVVYVYVNSTLWNDVDIQSKIFRYKSDIESTGYGVYLLKYISGSPENIKYNLTNAPSNLVGCVFIGDIPTAWFQYFNDPEWGHANYSEFPIDLFYMDLDGTWGDSYNRTYANGTQWPGYGAPVPATSDGIYDYHADFNKEPEIWVGRIKADDMDDPEVDLVKNYFDKNHDYRIGVTANPQNALFYVDDDWSPGTTIRDAIAGAFPDINHRYNKSETRRDNYLTNLTEGYSWVHLMSHGNPSDHSFKIPDENGTSQWEGGSHVSGRTTYKNGNYPNLFYNLFVCSGARFTSSNYLGGWVLFSGETLGVIGSTKTGSMINDADFYTPLSTGIILGEAYREWFDDTLNSATSYDQKQWYYGMTYLGDPTLWATGPQTVTIDISGLESETVDIHYTQSGTDYVQIVTNGVWSKICDHGTQVYINTSIIIKSSTERYHTNDTISWWVNGPLTETVSYHTEYKITIIADGLPSSASTNVTIGTANPSSSDTVSGGDIQNYILELNQGNSFTWTNWVHADTDLTALSSIEYAPNEKYILICWTKNLIRDDPPTVYADEKGVVYSAQYVGFKKEMSSNEAELVDTLTVTIEASTPSTGTTDDSIEIIDNLPNEMSYVIGSAMIDGSSYTPTIDEIATPQPHQNLTFSVDADGSHTITFEVKINRAYGGDTDVNNYASASFDFEDVPVVNLDMFYTVTIHPYNGSTLSKEIDGLEIVPIFTESRWVFTFIIKNNYDYEMALSILKDNFAAELDYDNDTIIANLLTNPFFNYSNGNANKVKMEWILPDIAIGEAYMLQVEMFTKVNPGGNQLFASPGEYTLNAGATLKFNDDSGKKLSLETDPITVTAVV